MTHDAPHSLDSASRRDFLQTSAGSVAAGALAATVVAHPQRVHAASGANSRLRVGLIGCGNRMKALLGSLLKLRDDLRNDGKSLDITDISELYTVFAQQTAARIKEKTGVEPKLHLNYRELLKVDLDLVVIATPDHWHARQTLDALAAGKHVYCEKPMTHTVDEAHAVVDAWRKSGRIMQVGVQSTSLPVWDQVRAQLQAGKLGKVLQFRTEYFRNSNTGQARFHELTEEMTPQTIDWRRWLGLEFALAPDMPFDRAVFRQWRCYKAFSGGMLTDLFVHRLTAMLLATGLRYPARVTTGGGIFLEYDDRELPDTATVVLDYPEGVQGVISATMCAEVSRPPQVICGHLGSFIFPNGEMITGYDFLPERPQVTLDSSLQPEHVDLTPDDDSTTTHMRDFLKAVETGKQEHCGNNPELGAAATVAVQMAKRSYFEGKAVAYDPTTRKVVDADAAWAAAWEQMSKARAKPRQLPGWTAGDRGSTLRPPEFMKRAGPWIDGKPPGGG